MSHFIINTEYGRLIFFITYNLAFMIALALFIIKNRASGNPLTKTWLTAASGTLFFILGLYYSTVPPQELLSLFQGKGLAEHHEKNLVGGVAGLLLGVLIAARWLRLRKGVLDDFAIALPLGMAVHRIGCFFTGCCFGRPAELPWSVCYPSGSQAFCAHPADLVALPEIRLSLPVHPVQLYEVILCLAIMFIVWKVRKRFRAPGNLFRFSMILYGLMWFGCEFFRDPAGVYIAGKTILGLRLIQWILLASVLMFVMVFWYMERNVRDVKEKEEAAETSGLLRIASFAVLLGVLFVVLKNRIELIDKLLISLLLFPGVLMTGWKIYQRTTVPQYRFLLVAISVSGFVFISQVYVPVNKEEKVKYTEIGFTGMWNGFSNTVQKAVRGYDQCGAMNYNFGWGENHRHNILLAGFHYADNHVKSKYNRTALYVNGFLGVENETGINCNYSSQRFTGAVNLGGRFDWQYFGFRAGIWLGAFQMTGLPNNFNEGNNYIRVFGLQSHHKNKVGEYSGNFEEIYFFPQIGIRVGPADIFFLNLHLAEVNPATAAPVLFQAGVGTGFGKVNGPMFETGISTIGFYLHGGYLIDEKFLVSAYLSNNLGLKIAGTYDNTCVSVGLQYRFGYKTVKKEHHEAPQAFPGLKNFNRKKDTVPDTLKKTQ